MKPEVGKYKFGRHRNHWGIYRYVVVHDDGHGYQAEFIKDVDTYEEAVREMYRLNGWKVPEKIVKKWA